MVLEGLIRNVGTSGNRENIQLIEDLASVYISKPNCIILMTITCESMPSFLSCINVKSNQHPKPQRTSPTKAHTGLHVTMTRKGLGPLVGRLHICLNSHSHVVWCIRCINQAG